MFGLTAPHVSLDAPSFERSHPSVRRNLIETLQKNRTPAQAFRYYKVLRVIE